MFFDKQQDARLYARIETIRTHRPHVVKPCKKYLCPTTLGQEEEYIAGYTVCLSKNAIQKR